MFEQATLTNGPSGVRAWTTFLGLTSQVALVSLAVLAPMVWPQVLPTARFLETLAPPLPPAPAPRQLGEVKHIPVTGRVLKPWSLILSQPARVPTRIIYDLVDEPSGPPVVVGATGPAGNYAGVMNGILGGLGTATPVPVPRVATPVAKPPEGPAAVPRYRVGGNVYLGAVLHKAEPQYPAIAKAAHISGSVDLECVVGVDGHIQEVKVRSGNPLLIRAAVEAAWQWVYAPTKLNGVPIELVTMLTFSFKLN